MKKRIVVIEDDDQTAKLIKIILEGAGYEVANLYHGVDALQYLAKESFDLVLLDVRLPGYDGFEILNWLRTKSGRKATPVIMLSADVMKSSHQRAFDLGAADYIDKPFQLDDLVNRIERVLKTAVFVWPTFSQNWQPRAAK